MQDIDGGHGLLIAITPLSHTQTPEADRSEYLNPLYQKQPYERERVVNQIKSLIRPAREKKASTTKNLSIFVERQHR